MRKEITFAVKAPNWLGDAVMALPAVTAVADCSRRGRVVVLGSGVATALYSRVQGTLPLEVTRPGGSLLRSARSILEGGRLLRQFGPVMGLSLTRSFTSAAMLYAGRVPRRIGFDDAAGAFLYTDRVRRPPRSTTHLIDTFNTLVEAIGIKVDSRVPRLEPGTGDIRAAEQDLKDDGLDRGAYICLFPGARYGPAKRWPARRFGLLGNLIADKFKRTVVLLGGPHERAVCDEVEKAIPGRYCLNLCGRTNLTGLIGLLWFSGGVVANDSGGMHLAAALGKPVVGLFFSTDPGWTGPVSENSVAIYKGMECSPCFERDCRRGNACTETIGEQEVLETLARVARLRA
jgi:heptosyltransferase-2